MTIKLSILDQSPLFEGDTPREAFAHTLELVQKAEQLGYHRFWVSEHHDSSLVAGSSPEVLISYLLARTERIRLGSGGIMLQHYSPYKVAENFNVLATLAPGRVDLGIGRAPGGLPRSTQALQKGTVETESLSDKLIQLEQYVHNRLPEEHPLTGLQAVPVPEQPADIYVLGASVNSAELAADLGHPYVFAQFINGDPAVADQAFSVYAQRFNSNNSKSLKPEPILALSVIVGENDEEAALLAKDFINVKIHLENGKTVTVGSIEQAEEFGRQSNQKYRIEVQAANITTGSKETIRHKLLEAQQRYGVEEFIITTAVKDFSQRIRSYELLHEAFSETSVQG